MRDLIADIAIVDRRASRPPRRDRIPRPAPGELFLRGPIPLIWLATAARLPGKALHVGLLVWFEAGLRKGASIKLTRKWNEAWGLQRDAVSRALHALENALLVRVERRRGCAPVVTLLKAALSPSQVALAAPTMNSESHNNPDCLDFEI